MEYCFSRDIDYHTQRNNRIIPLKSCGTTSMVMALKQAGIDFESPNHNQQPEDYLTELLLEERAIEEMRRLASWAFDRNGEPVYPPNEVHVMLEWVINCVTKAGIDRFSPNYSIAEICEHLLKGGGVVLSGNFPVDTGELNHMVSLAGFIYDTDASVPIDVGKIRGFIIDDPYGDWRRSYRSEKGNDVRIEFDEFVELFKKPGSERSKWAHLVSSAGC